MAAILMINVPYAGHTNPTLPLAEALVRNGHKVFYVNAEEFRTKIERTGAEFIPCISLWGALSAIEDFAKNASALLAERICR
ncbi:MAG: hypothetical protein VB051_01055 [Candidatus Pelethousia sp.]|nr:hypothetical protein [Candidatus Pelethousia sp.]